MATLIKVSGETVGVAPKDGKAFTLEELQGFVGGYIEVLYQPDGRVLVFNEEGKLNGLSPNMRATVIAAKCGIAHDDFIVGDALDCTTKEMGD